MTTEPTSNRDPRLSDTTRRHGCPHCGTMVVVGAQKCRGCKRWLRPRSRHPSRFTRSLILVAATVVLVISVLLTSRPSPVGEAPPLMRVSPTASTTAAASQPTPSNEPVPPLTPVEEQKSATIAGKPWKGRSIQLEEHPLDVVFSRDAKTLFVSTDDATIYAFNVANGAIRHKMRVPAQGDRLRLLADRYLAVIRLKDAARIPLVDTEAWDRDPVLIDVGADPVDVLELPSGKTAVAASSRGRRLTWFDLEDGRRRDNIRLPHQSQQLLLLRSSGRPYVGAVGQLLHDQAPAGAWIDLFDPTESPFGATRRSIAIGRDPGQSAVTRDGARVLLVDNVANTATLLDVDEQTEKKTLAVDEGPIAAFFMNGDKTGVVLNSAGRTATVIDMKRFEKASTVMLASTPSHAALSGSEDTLIVALGGSEWPPKGSGAVILSGTPLSVSATLDTGRGASRVAASRNGQHAAITCYYDRQISLLSR